MDISPIADVDPDVAHVLLVLSLSEREQVAREEQRCVFLNRETFVGLEPSRARDMQVERAHHVGDQTTTIEAAFWRLSTGSVPLADLRASHLDD